MVKLTDIYAIPYTTESNYAEAIERHGDEIESILRSEYNFRKGKGFKFKANGMCHFEAPPKYEEYDEFVAFNADEFIETVIEYAQAMPIKDGVDAVRLDNGNLGILAYYSGHETLMEIIFT